MKNQIIEFLSKNPTENQIENYYINKILPFDKRSINEILEEN